MFSTPAKLTQTKPKTILQKQFESSHHVASSAASLKVWERPNKFWGGQNA